MALAHWNRHLLTFGIAPAEGLHANQLVAKVAVVALVGQVTPRGLFAEHAQGEGHALGEGPWISARKEMVEYGSERDATQKGQCQQYPEHF